MRNTTDDRLPFDLIQFLLVSRDHLVSLHEAHLLHVPLGQLVLLVDLLLLQFPQHRFARAHCL